MTLLSLDVLITDHGNASVGALFGIYRIEAGFDVLQPDERGE